MKDGKGTEINIIKIISHADEGVEKDRTEINIVNSIKPLFGVFLCKGLADMKKKMYLCPRYNILSHIIMVNETKNNTSNMNTEVKEEKRHNPTWEAAMKYQPAFTFVAPEMYD